MMRQKKQLFKQVLHLLLAGLERAGQFLQWVGQWVEDTAKIQRTRL